MGDNDKVLVIGLDGVPLSLIQPWAEQGHLPTMQRLIAGGAVGHLKSTIPPTSGPSWSAFQTGKNPGKTNIYDFLYRREGSYQLPPVSVRQRDGQSLWGIASQAGLRVGVLNMPMSYPVEAINGFMVSGWMTPYAARDFVHPPELLDELKREVGFYKIYPTETFSEGRKEAFLHASYQLMDMRTRTALYLMDKHPWELLTVIYFDTDRVLHQLWHYLDPTHPWRHDTQDKSYVVRDYFQRLDAKLGQLLQRAGDDTLVIVLSDHGMGPAHNFVVLNNWLLEVGLMRLKRDPFTRLKAALFEGGFTLRNVHKLVNRLGLSKQAEYKMGYFVDHLIKLVFLSFLDVDWSRTHAYSFGRHLGSIYLNVKGREPQGIVEPGSQYEQVREDIIHKTKQFVDPRDGRPLIGQVLKREDIYHGPHLEHAPDLTLTAAEPTDIFFGLADFGSNNLVDTVYRYSGMHRDYGMLIVNGKHIKPGSAITGAEIIDLAPTILHAMGLDVPTDMDGRVLSELFAENSPYDRPVKYGDNGHSSVYDPTASYTPEGEKEIIERLEALGYLG